jgi:diamine N-acetyltransferase
LKHPRKSNAHARALYEKIIGFIDQELENKDGEVIYKMKLK